MNESLKLRPYQVESVEALREMVRNGHLRLVLCSPTGSGKTIVAVYLIGEALAKRSRVLFIVERVSLVNQTSDMLDKFGIDHGVIQANHWRTRPGEPIQIATAQSLAKRGWPAVDLVIVDEAHVLMKDTIEQISKLKCPVIGLTATPFTKGMGAVYSGIVNVTTSNKLTSEGFLVPFKVFAASEPDMTGAKVVAGEWSESEASERAMPIIGDCVKEYLQHGKGGKFIAFGVNVAHCEEMKRQFLAAGVLCELHTYKTPDDERDSNMKEFRKPDSYIRGLISVSALSRGLDVPDVSCIIMCRPLKSSFSEFIQIIGRGLRPYPDKEFCTILDHSGNTVRFWPQMQELFEDGVLELDDGMAKEAKAKKPPKEKPPVKCPQCFHVHKRRPTCPSCGYVYPARQSVTHEAGELQEVGKTALASRAEKQAWFSQLLFLADERGYKDGWVKWKYKERFGVWPVGLDYETKPPTREVLGWVTSRAIAYSKANPRRAMA